MTGIERLRALAYKKNFLEPAEAWNDEQTGGE